MNEEHAQRKIAEVLDASDWVGDDAPSDLATTIVTRLLRAGFVIVGAEDVEMITREYIKDEHAFVGARQRLRESVRCRCETLHGHCYAVACSCPTHADEVSST